MEKDYIVIKTNESKAASYTSALDKICDILNNAVQVFKGRGWIESDPTTDNFKDWLNGNCNDIKSHIESDFNEETKGVIKRAVRNFFDGEMRKAKAEAEAVFKSNITDPLKSTFRLLSEQSNMADVIPLVVSCEGKATYDPQAVKDLASDLVPYDPQVIAFIKRAKQLFRDLAKFDQDVRKLSHGSAKGWGDIDEMNNFLSSDGSNMWLDLRAMAWLDFGNAEAVVNEELVMTENHHIQDIEDKEQSFLKLLEDVEQTEVKRRGRPAKKTLI
ncbi:MAG: hypothetical protein LIP09_08060 [Bacteroidales bacterium]|nr:hypothetical protein [Bacteroidales bacterium]